MKNIKTIEYFIFLHPKSPGVGLLTLTYYGHQVTEAIQASDLASLPPDIPEFKSINGHTSLNIRCSALLLLSRTVDKFIKGVSKNSSNFKVQKVTSWFIVSMKPVSEYY